MRNASSLNPCDPERKDDFTWLQKWYHAHCNGDWEHGNGIHLGTIDNPGWRLTINLGDTELEDKKFEKIHIERSENDWIFCTVRNGKFEGGVWPHQFTRDFETIS